MIPSMTKWAALGIVAGAFAVGVGAGWGLHVMHARPMPTFVMASVPVPVPVPAPGPVPAAHSKAIPPLPSPSGRVVGPPKPLAPPKPLDPSVSVQVPDAAPATVVTPSILAGLPTPTPTPGHIYRVEAGDTLSEITQRAFGSTRRLAEVMAANPGLDATKMKRGTLVYVPLEKGAQPSNPAAVTVAPVAPPSLAPSPK